MHAPVAIAALVAVESYKKDDYAAASLDLSRTWS